MENLEALQIEKKRLQKKLAAVQYEIDALLIEESNKKLPVGTKVKIQRKKNQFLAVISSHQCVHEEGRPRYKKILLDGSIGKTEYSLYSFEQFEIIE